MAKNEMVKVQSSGCFLSFPCRNYSLPNSTTRFPDLQRLP